MIQKNYSLIISTIILFSFIFIQQVQAQIIDEIEGGKVQEEAITNRPMNSEINLQAIQKAFDDSNQKDPVLTLLYDKNITYKIRLREYMTTTINLPKWERILGYALGDETNFTFSPMGPINSEMNHIFQVYAKFSGSDTNLTVFGASENIYSFYLRADSVKSPFIPALVVYIEDSNKKKSKKVKEIMANKESKKEPVKNNKDYLRTLPKTNLLDRNFNYEILDGEKSLSPLSIFDDGYFTYFKFSNDGTLDKTSAPAIYRVVDGFDVIVNTRIEKGIIVAETINDKWTLRSGDKHLCIRAKKKVNYE